MSWPSNPKDIEWELILNALTAAAASFAGAYGAWKISTRAARRENLANEIMACNIAIGHATAIANTLLSIKKQRVAPLMAEYAAQRATQEAVARGLATQDQPMRADLRLISAPFLGTQYLRDSIEQVKHSKLAPMLFSSVQLSAVGFTEAIARRNELAVALLGKGFPEKETLYFGLPGATTVDESYPDAMEALRVRTDDGIYFSLLMADVLSAHAKGLCRKYGAGAPATSQLQLNAEWAALVPDKSQYKDFETQYRPRALASLGRTWPDRILRAIRAAVHGFITGLQAT